MSTRAAYIARIDSGERLAMVRLLGPRSDQSWLVEHIETDASLDRVLLDVQSAVTWLADRMSDTRSRTIDLLCLDAEGLRCTWIDAATPDDRIARAALRARSDTSWNPTAGWSPTGETTDAFSFHLLHGQSNGTAGAGHSPMRKGVIAANDALTRLLLDTLDEQGLVAHRVMTLPQAMAQAWDPDSIVRSRTAGNNGIAGNSAIAGQLDHHSTMVSAVVVVDPAGRLVWTWSRAGQVACFGTLAAPVRSDDEGVRLTRNLASRITADWLAWSVQIGMTPDRIVVLGPSSPVPFRPGEDTAQSMLSLGEFGAAISASWNNASCDVVPVDDPIGQTLDRVVVAMEQGVSSRQLPAMDSIERRPSRAHRSMRRWLAVAGMILAIALVGVGARAQSHARTIRESGIKHRADAVREAKEILPDLDGSFARTDLEGRIQKMTVQKADTSIAKMPPILSELENILYGVTSLPDPEIESIQFTSFGVAMKVTLPNLAAYDDLRSMFTGEGFPTEVNWETITPRTAGDKQSVSMNGRWLAGGGL